MSKILKKGNIRGAVLWQEMESEEKILRFFHDLIKKDELAIMEDFLNRILYAELWEKNDHLKSFKYLYCFYKGAWNVEKFILVPISLVYQEILVKKKNTTNELVLQQLERGISAIKEHLDMKKKYFIIDGMGRTLTTWKPFFEGKDWARIPSGERIGPLTLDYDDGSEEILNGKKWVDISEAGQESLLDGGIDIAIVKSGSLAEITMCLVAKNQNEKFTSWQQLYHGQFISAFGFHIKNALTEPIKDFLKVHTNINTSNIFKEKISGFEYFIAEMLYFLAVQRVASIDDFQKAFEENSIIVLQKHVDSLNSYFNELIDAFPTSKSVEYKIGFVRNYIIFRDALDRRKTKNIFYSTVCDRISELKGKIPSTSKNGFVTWFIKTHQHLSDKHWDDGFDKNGNALQKVNHISWVEEHNILTSVKGGYFKSTSSESDSNFAAALKWLIKQFSRDVSILLDQGVWKTTTRNDTPVISEVASFRDWKDRYGNDVEPKNLSSYIIGHIIAEKNPEGETEVKNLVLQKPLGNAQYGGKNLIGNSQLN